MPDKYSQNSNPTGDKRAAHGLTYGDLEKIHDDQVHETVRDIECNKNSDYTIPEYEAKTFFLVLLETPLFDQGTGKRLSTPKLKKFHSRQYHHMIKEKQFTGYTVEVLHNPEEYVMTLKGQKPDPNTGNGVAKQEDVTDDIPGNLDIPKNPGPDDNAENTGSKPNQEVIVCTDLDSHWYWIPKEAHEDFQTVVSAIEAETPGAADLLSERYEIYRTGGDPSLKPEIFENVEVTIIPTA